MPSPPGSPNPGYQLISEVFQLSNLTAMSPLRRPTCSWKAWALEPAGWGRKTFQNFPELSGLSLPPSFRVLVLFSGRKEL